MIGTLQIGRIKEISIVDYLASKGHTPSKVRGHEYVYYSPIRNEHTPSFFVNPAKNVYKDWGKDGGDIIKLVMEMSNCDFLGAVKILNDWEPDTLSSFIHEIQVETGQQIENGVEILKVQPITHQALINYIKNRNITFSFAAKYLKEVHYCSKGTRFFSIGFQNDNGGWALRNQRFKNCIGNQGVTYLKVPNSKAISVFEGFFDFLSALTYFKTDKSKNSVLVLNSTSNLKNAFNILSTYEKINLYLDNDAAGFKAVSELEKRQLPIFDKSNLYSAYNDFSDMICNKDKS
jgi:DNA primase